jgi:hypothetical protein
VERKKLLFVDSTKKTSTVSPISFMSESLYKAYDRNATGRELYVAISIIEKLHPELASQIKMASIQDPINKDPA